jgi:hypothetical protein
MRLSEIMANPTRNRGRDRSLDRGNRPAEGIEQHEQWTPAIEWHPFGWSMIVATVAYGWFILWWLS